MATKPIILKRTEWVRVYRWIDEHKAELQLMRASEAAKAAGNALGLPLTENHIRSACSDCDVKLAGSRQYRRKDAPESMNKRMSFLASQIVVLARILQDLHETLGASFPEGRVNLEVLKQMRVGVVPEVPPENGMFRHQ